MGAGGGWTAGQETGLAPGSTLEGEQKEILALGEGPESAGPCPGHK